MSRGVWGRCSQKHSDGALLREEKACLDCLITTNRPEMGLERAGRIIHHLQWQHLPAFLFTFGLAALLIGAGLLVNLHLRTQRLAPGRRVSGFRRASAAPMGYTPAANSRGADTSTRYTRKAVVTSILLLVLLSVILLGAISAAVH